MLPRLLVTVILVMMILFFSPSLIVQASQTKDGLNWVPTLDLKTPNTSSAQISSWQIKSVSSMKETKDRICNPRDLTFINNWVNRAEQLGVNYVSIETPYDNPTCGNSVEYTRIWLKVVRSKGLQVWHRHTFLGFEGIYGVPKTKQDFLNQISSYIKDNPSFFKDGDIFTPIPEPQNGGILGVNDCPGGLCQFSSASDFNSWLREAVTVSQQSFDEIGVRNIKIGYFGFDGFIAWGDNNPDWNGILEDDTVKLMGNITIDHYPQLVGGNMASDLDKLENKYPGVPIIIGEWGAISPDDPETQIKETMQAAERPSVIGFNYWHLGMGGTEALINDDFSKKPQFKTVASFFKSF